MTDVSSIDLRQAEQRLADARRAVTHDFAKELLRHREQSKAPMEAGDGMGKHDEVTPHAAADASIAPTSNALNQAVASMSTEEILSVAVQPIGVTQSLRSARIYGVHLLAGAYLSELNAAEEAGVHHAGAAPATAINELDTGSQPPSFAVPVASLAEQHAEGDSVASATQAGPAAMVEASTVDAGSFSGADVLAISGGTIARWSDSLLRFVRLQDGSMVAWVRNYRIDAKEVPRVIANLLNKARAQGVVLSRIMLNGREAWSSRHSE